MDIGTITCGSNAYRSSRFTTKRKMIRLRWHLSCVFWTLVIVIILLPLFLSTSTTRTMAGASQGDMDMAAKTSGSNPSSSTASHTEGGGKEGEDNDNDNDETVEEMLDGYHLAASRADAETYFGYFAKDAYFIGTDATERWTVEEFRKYAIPFMSKGQGWTYRPKKRFVNYYYNSNDKQQKQNQQQIAWFDEILENDRFGVTRSSGVVIRENNRWKIAQYHLTVPIPNGVMDQVVAIIRENNKNKNINK